MGIGPLRSNLVWHALSFGVQAGVGLWYIPYLIGHLGLAAYGLVPLATQIASYLSILTSAQTSAMGRFLTVDLARRDLAQASRTFSTAVFGMFGAVVVLIPVAALVALMAPRLVSIPPGQETDAYYLLAGALSSVLLILPTNAFLSSSFAKNRLDIQTKLAILGVIIRSALVVVFFAVLSPAVWQVGAALAATALLTLVLSLVVWRKLAPALHLRWSSFDKQRLAQLVGTGNWLILNQAGVLLLYNIDLVVVSAIAGAVAVGVYGALLQWPVLVRAFAGVMGHVLAPTITSRVARGDTQSVALICHQSARLMGFALSLPAGLICGLSSPLLRLWLGEEFAAHSWLLVAITAHIPITSSAQPMAATHVATTQVRWPGLVSVVSGAANVGLALLLGRELQWGMCGVAAASMVVFVLRNGIFLPWYTARILGQSALPFLGNTAVSAFYTAVVAGATALSSRALHVETWGTLAASAVLATIVWGALAHLALPREDRALLRRLGGLRANP